MAATTAGAGTAIFRINGTQTQVRGSVTIMPLTQEATAGRNVDGSLYFTVKPVPSYIELEAQDTGGTSLQSFEGFVDEYITVELFNGKVYGLSNAVFTGGLTLNAMEGTYKARFDGDCTELTA